MLQFCRSRRVLALVFLLMMCGQGVAAAQVAWVKSFNEAMKQAASEQKFILLDISASW